jgi:predicted transcriptional regulator
MIGVRLSESHERKLVELARQSRMKPGPFARRVLIAYIEEQHDMEAAVVIRLARIERHLPTIARLVLRLEKKVDAFLEHVEIVDPT